MRLESVFTKQERLALGFLVGAGLLGMAVQLCGLERSGQYRFIPRPEVSVNRAGAAELVALPGIGPVTARRILEDRELHGRFLTLGDLRRVKGLTPKTLQKIRGYVRFD